jgi:hypothetical protein
MSKKNVFIPHRWGNEDYEYLSALLDRTMFNVVDYSVPSTMPLQSIDYRYKVDPQIRKKIQYASFVLCSNRPANGSGIASQEIQYAVALGKPVIAVMVTKSTSSLIVNLDIPLIPCRRDSLERWVNLNT